MIHSPCLTLTLEKGENILMANGALDVTDKSTGLVVHEFNSDLGDTTTGASTAENLQQIEEYQRAAQIRIDREEGVDNDLDDFCELNGCF